MNQTLKPLTRDEIADKLHAMVFELEHLTGNDLAGDTAIKTGRAALLMIMAGLIRASEPQP